MLIPRGTAKTENTVIQAIINKGLTIEKITKMGKIPIITKDELKLFREIQCQS